MNKKIFFLALFSLFTLISCNKGNGFEFENGNNFAVLNVNNDKFDQYSNLDNPDYLDLIQETTKLSYKKFKDDFDFQILMLDNEEYPPNTPSAIFFMTKNTTPGIGVRTNFDENAKYGSSSRLKGVIVLFRNHRSNRLIGGPLLHEIGHKFFNHVIANSAPHWDHSLVFDPGRGIFNSPTNVYSDIELYLMGLISYNQFSETSQTSRNLYNQISLENRNAKEDISVTQKSYKALLTYVTNKNEVYEPAQLNSQIDYVTAQNMANQYVNFYRQTKGLATLEMANLSASLK